MSEADRIDPPVYTAPWYQPVAINPFRGDPEFGQEDPEGLRASGSRRVATALAGLAEEGRLSWRKDVREISDLLLQWLDQDGGQFDDLASDIGLRPKRGPAFTQIKRQAERDAILREVIALPRWRNQSARQTARDIRDDFEEYEACGWLRDRDNPGRPQGQLRVLWWRILKLKLHYPLPSIQAIAGMIEDARR